jgi:GntR family transcriptional regulator
VEETQAREPAVEMVLPSEAELGATFGVSRGTIRHALEVLEREGLVFRRQGKGTFIGRRRLAYDLTRLSSTTEDLLERGWKPGSRVLGIEAVRPRAAIQGFLQLPKGARVWELRRLRLADGEPVCLVSSYLPVRLTPGLDKHDLTGSLAKLLAEEYGIKLRTADQTIRARGAVGEEAELLGVPEGEPIFMITRVAYDEQGTPVEYLGSLWRGDRYDLQVRRVSGD